MRATTQLIPARLRSGDMARVASVGLRTRRLRAALSALGIAIGVAIVAVLGLSSSSQAGLLAEIDRLGTNLLTVTNGQTFTGQTATLPLTAPAMIGRINPVTKVADAGDVSAANAFRSPLIPSIDTNALTVDAASLNLLPAVGTTVAEGSYLNAATATEPAVVLGAAAARRLGLDRVYRGERVWLGGMWFYVVGILKPALLAPEIDSSALAGYVAAERYLNYTSTAGAKTTIGPTTTIYVRAQDTQVNAVDNVLADTADLQNPSYVDVSQPSAAPPASRSARSPPPSTPTPNTGHRDPHRSLGRRNSLRDPDRRRRRTHARDPGRPPLTHRRTQNRLTTAAPSRFPLAAPPPALHRSRPATHADSRDADNAAGFPPRTRPSARDLAIAPLQELSFRPLQLSR